MTITDMSPTHGAARPMNGHQSELMLALGRDRPAVAARLNDTTQTDVAPVSHRRWYAPLMTLDITAMWPAMVAAFGVLLIIGFTMSFHGLFVFGDKIMHWATALCALAPIGIDVFSILALLATFLTREAPRRIRAYVWIVFGFSVALSIAGNALAEVALATERAGKTGLVFDASAEQVSALVGAAVWPAFYAVALHTLIVVRRAIDRKRADEATLAERLATEAKVEQGLEVRAVRLAAGGSSVAEIMAELELPDGQKRTVERWTKPIRDALKTASEPAPKAVVRRPQRP
jgi:hypothetical protein